MEDPASFGTLLFCVKRFHRPMFTDANLVSLTICGAVSLSLERGICDASCFAFAWLGMIAGHGFGDYEKDFDSARLATNLLNDVA